MIISQSILTALIGIYMLASGVQGIFLAKKIAIPLRILALACALCMIISGTVTDIIGIAILAVLIAYVKFFAKAEPTFA